MKIEQQANRFQSDVEKILADLKDATQEQIPELRDRLEAALESARDTGNGVFDNVRSAARSFAGLAADNLCQGRDSACDYISNNPWRAAAVIGAAGVLLGAVISRRN